MSQFLISRREIVFDKFLAPIRPSDQRSFAQWDPALRPPNGTGLENKSSTGRDLTRRKPKAPNQGLENTRLARERFAIGRLISLISGKIIQTSGAPKKICA
jgi:hypothetical protein